MNKEERRNFVREYALENCNKDNIPLDEQIEDLTKYLIENFSDYIMYGGATDVAISLLAAYKKECKGNNITLDIPENFDELTHEEKITELSKAYIRKNKKPNHPYQSIDISCGIEKEGG